MGWGWWGAVGGLIGLTVDWLAQCAPTWLRPGATRQRSLPGVWRLLAAGGLAAGWALVGAGSMPTPSRVVLAVWLAGLLLLALIDLRFHLLPHLITLTLTILPLVVYFRQSTALGVWSALGALSGGLFLWLVYGLARLAYGTPGLGLGDVSLGLALGVVTGPVDVWWALAVGMGIGGATALVWRLRGAPPRARLPYGACLIAGALVVEMSRLALSG